MTYKLLDLFCGQGGAAYGYHLAGFEVTGVDIRKQPHFPFKFIQADALVYLAEHGQEYDVIHASPPCQAYSRTRRLRDGYRKGEHADLVEPTRELLARTGRPYVIENVTFAPLYDPLILDGTRFGLRVVRERAFEVWPRLYVVPPPRTPLPGHTARRGEYDRGQAGMICPVGHNFDPAVAREAMGIPWMTRDGLAQAIPPAYTRWIGSYLLARLVRGSEA